VTFNAVWTYPSELADALARFGLSPQPHTSPVFVRDALNDLYRYELRRLRDRLLAGQIAKPDYVGIVISLRKKYWPLSMLPQTWEEVCRG
jgi:hypothetical protein